jgi:hypothetical protein
MLSLGLLGCIQQGVDTETTKILLSEPHDIVLQSGKEPDVGFWKGS